MSKATLRVFVCTLALLASSPALAQNSPFFTPGNLVVTVDQLSLAENFYLHLHMALLLVHVDGVIVQLLHLVQIFRSKLVLPTPVLSSCQPLLFLDIP